MADGCVIIRTLAGAATDEQARKRLLFIILAPVIFLLTLTAYIVYLLTTPLSLLADLALDTEELEAIKSFQKNYGYNQNMELTGSDYVEGSNRSYEGMAFTDGGREVIYYSQFDKRWAGTMYGTSSTIGQAGCGPTSMAIVVSTLTGRHHDPLELAGWSAANGYRCEGNGSYHSLIPAAASYYGLSCKGNLTAQDIVDALSSGKLIVVIMSKGHFTKGGHFIVLRGVTEEGKVLVADPASYKRSGQEWDLSIILKESNKAAAAGGPYWAIGT